MKKKIDFFIAGVHKSGTTTLYDLLSQDSRIYLPKIKENPSFTNPNIEMGFLEMLYSEYEFEELIGGAYANAIFFEDSAKKLYENNNQIKIIIILRNPVDRAYSAYNYSYRLGIEKNNSFEIAINAELKNNYSNYIDIANRTYLKHGLYYNQIVKYMEVFPAEHIHIILFDDLLKNAENVLKGIYNFIGLKYKKNISFVKSNSSSIVKLSWLHKLLFQENMLKTVYQRFMPKKLHYVINYKLVKKLESINKTNKKYKPINLKIKKYLQGYFFDHNKKLEKLIKRDLSAWNK